MMHEENGVEEIACPPNNDDYVNEKNQGDHGNTTATLRWTASVPISENASALIHASKINTFAIQKHRLVVLCRIAVIQIHY